MKLPRIRDIVVREWNEPVSIFAVHPEDRAAPLAILATGGDVPGHRFSIVGTNPFLIIRENVGSGEKDPFAVLKEVFSEYASLPAHPFLPFSGGAIVALAYDLKDAVEKVPPHAADDLGLPDLIAIFFREYVVIDEKARRAWRVQVVTGDSAGGEAGRGRARHDHDALSKNLSSNFTRAAYLQAVRRVIEHIRAGDIYQANIAQRFALDFSGDPFSLFTDCATLNPAPMMAYLRLPECTLVSTSPERFLKREGNNLITAPIKGTRPRGKTPAEDERLMRELWESPKENAELAMIVDLMRNDVGKLAIPGSVSVADPKRIESYTNVHHLVATVAARVAPEISSWDIIKACFPAGSITGCPKIRAMEIIEAIESVKRSFYCGSIGWFGFNGDFDLNVAIRTFITTNGKLFWSLGGGIVADSDPAAEYEETLHKGATMFELVRRNAQ